MAVDGVMSVCPCVAPRPVLRPWRAFRPQPEPLLQAHCRGLPRAAPCSGAGPQQRTGCSLGVWKLRCSERVFLDERQLSSRMQSLLGARGLSIGSRPVLGRVGRVDSSELLQGHLLPPAASHGGKGVTKNLQTIVSRLLGWGKEASTTMRSGFEAPSAPAWLRGRPRQPGEGLANRTRM